MQETLMCTICSKTIGDIKYNKHYHQYKRQGIHLIICNDCEYYCKDKNKFRSRYCANELQKHRMLEQQKQKLKIQEKNIRKKYQQDQKLNKKIIAERQKVITGFKSLLTPVTIISLQQYRDFIANITSKLPNLRQYFSKSKKNTLKSLQYHMKIVIKEEISQITSYLQKGCDQNQEKITKLQEFRQNKRRSLEEMEEMRKQSQVSQQIPGKGRISEEFLLIQDQQEVTQFLLIYDKKIKKLQERFSILDELRRQGYSLIQSEIEEIQEKQFNPEQKRQKIDIKESNSKSVIKGD